MWPLKLHPSSTSIFHLLGASYECFLRCSFWVSHKIDREIALIKLFVRREQLSTKGTLLTRAIPLNYLMINSPKPLPFLEMILSGKETKKLFPLAITFNPNVPDMGNIIRCGLYRNFFVESKSSLSFQTEQKYTIYSRLSCDSKNVNYLASFKKCPLQYVGSTTTDFADFISVSRDFTQHLRWLNRVMQDHEARASDLNRKLIFSFFLLFS